MTGHGRGTALYISKSYAANKKNLSKKCCKRFRAKMSKQEERLTLIVNVQHTNKAPRLVAKAALNSMIDYEDTFFSSKQTIRAIRMHIAIKLPYYDYENCKWNDKTTAFLNGSLMRTQYGATEGYVRTKFPNGVCKLQRAI
ncbi:hypothetical protein Tco_0659250 [Tanacetum coccineum]